MEIKVNVGDPLKEPSPTLVVGCFEQEPAAPLVGELDQALGGCLSALYREGEFTGKLNKSALLHTLGRAAAERLLLVGLGKRGELSRERLRQAAGTAMQALRGAGLKSACSVLHLAAGGGEEWLRAAVEGHLLGAYSFDRYKTGSDNNGGVAEVTILVPAESDLAAAERLAGEGRTLCEGVILARDLVAQPANVATPAFLAEKALEVAGRYGIDCRVMEREEMERNGMEALLAVAKGSSQPPRLIILEYRGGGEKERPTVLVGKGITFDSGGISLKPREGMEKMKNDMAGGAAVLGAVTVAARLRLPVNLVGLVPAAENLPGGRAYKPGDLVTAMAGKTVEIVNTDAEGRLVLCDALHYAQRYRPAALIDIATLTGACVVALGSFATGVMGNDQGLVRALKRAGEESGERLWELPLWDEYGELMRSDIADLKNAGGPSAGTISAGWFLKQFAGKGKWAHLDIAGTAWEEKGRPYLPKGATGVGVRLLVEYLRGVADSGKSA
ncbi:MAG: leucyl aminopeptidase [Geobacteraceae bacterium]|nr:leucyl aminopeptidase [Geobacteraceae bacterium]